jgi:hypothetical protein
MNGARRSTTRHTPITNLPELILPPLLRAARAGRVLHAAEVGMSQSVTLQSRLFSGQGCVDSTSGVLELRGKADVDD